MQISSPEGNKTRKVVLSSAFLCAALMLSLAESILLPAGILPVPGAKLGLANAAVLLCAVLMGTRYAAAISSARIILMFFLFGNGTSIIYSLSGAIFSFFGIALFSQSKHFSFIGKSVISAVLHNIAQVGCAVLIIGKGAAVLTPFLIITGVMCGAITGIILNLCYSPVYKYFRNRFSNIVN